MHPRSIFGVLAASIVLAACGTPANEPSEPKRPFPPNDRRAIERVYGQELREMGLRLARASLRDRTGGRYDLSDTGTHLALYVEPIGTIDTRRYVDNIAPLTKMFATDVFERWSGLRSFDICQEPILPAGEEEPRPVTQIELTRAQARRIDWERAGLPAMIRAALAEPPGIHMFLSTRVLKSSDYERAYRRAKEEVATPASPVRDEGYVEPSPSGADRY